MKCHHFNIYVYQHNLIWLVMITSWWKLFAELPQIFLLTRWSSWTSSSSPEKLIELRFNTYRHIFYINFASSIEIYTKFVDVLNVLQCSWDRSLALIVYSYILVEKSGLYARYGWWRSIVWPSLKSVYYLLRRLVILRTWSTHLTLRV